MFSARPRIKAVIVNEGMTPLAQPASPVASQPTTPMVGSFSPVPLTTTPQPISVSVPQVETPSPVVASPQPSVPVLPTIPTVQPPVSSAPVPSIPTEVPAPQQSPLKPNKGSAPGNGWIPQHKMLFLAPAALVLVGMIGVILLTNLGGNRNGVTPTPTTEPVLVPATPAPVETPNPFAAWKSYSNTALFSFSYPQTLSLKEVGREQGVFIAELRDLPLEATESGKVMWRLSALDGSVNETNVTKATGGLLKAIPKDEATEVMVSGISAQTGTVVSSSDPTINVAFAYWVREKTNYLVTRIISSDLDKVEFDSVLKRIKLLPREITIDWKNYSNSSGNFRLQYPPDWFVVTENGGATESANLFSIRKNEADSSFQNLTMEVSQQTGKTRIELTAQEVVSSIQNLSGWRHTPILDFRTIGGGQAQVLSGEKDGAWYTYAVVWYRSTLLQLIWKDTIYRPEQDSFDNMISTLQFLK